MRLTLWHAPALLLLYQTAPIHPRLDQAGRFRIGLGWSRGHYVDERFDCEGNTTQRAEARYTVVSGQAEAWIKPTLRVSVAGGVIRGSSDSAWAVGTDGGFGAVVLAHEGRSFGIGGGLALWPRQPDRSGHLLPSFYLRAGPADRVHLRIDDLASAAPSSPPVVRLGIAGGYGEKVRPRWFVGLAGWPFPSEDDLSVGLAGELGIPFGRVQPVVSGGTAHRDGNTSWTFGLGARVALGKR